jgi:pheromone alpha factor receptor
MDQITNYVIDRTVWGINVGAGIGASWLMLVAVVLLTKADKRRVPIFIFNVLALLINSIRGILHGIYISGPFQNLYALLTNDWIHITASNKAVSIADATLGLCVLIVIECSLLTQIWVVLATASRLQRTCIMAICAVVGLAAVSVEFAAVVINCQFIMALKSVNTPAFNNLILTDYIMCTVSVSFFCLIFLVKLGNAVLQRRRLGFKSFGPMQIIFIMAAQTMLIPSTFLWPIF